MTTCDTNPPGAPAPTKTVLVTEGATGLGRALVEHFAAEGWQVLFTAPSAAREGHALADALGDKARCMPAVGAVHDHAVMILQWATRFSDRLDLLICNGGRRQHQGISDTMPDEMADLLYANLMVPFLLLQQCRMLLERARGCVVHVGDAQASEGIAGGAVYAAAKAGLISLSRSAAAEFRPSIRVNAVVVNFSRWSAGTDPSCAEVGAWCDVVSAVAAFEANKSVTGTCVPIDVAPARIPSGDVQVGQPAIRAERQLV